MILLDAKAVMHHSYHIGKDPDSFVSELENEITTAAYGFNRFMERYMLPLFENHAPSDILVAHDDGTEFRTQILPTYKQTKSRTEQDPAEQKEQAALYEKMKHFWAYIGCTQAKVAGVEADDLLAYFCQKLVDPIHLYTVDLDLLQLQADHDHVEVLIKLEHQTEGHHKDILYKHTSLSKSMLGDNSDHYIGVKGFGRKKWDGLAEAYGEDVYDDLQGCVMANNYDAIKATLEDSPSPDLQFLYDNRVEWRKSWRLAMLNPELCWKPAKRKIPEISWFKRVPDATQIIKVFKAMGCADLFTHELIQPLLPVQWALTNEDIDEDLYDTFAEECANSTVVGFDYETYPSEKALIKTPKGADYLDVSQALVAGASFTFGANLNQTIYVPVNHKDTDNVRVEVVGKLLRIAEKNSTVVTHNSFFEIAVTKINLDFWMKPTLDTALMQSYVDEEAETRLKKISMHRLGYKQTTYEEVVTDPETGELRTMDQLTVEEVVGYGCDDAICTAHIFILYNIIMQLEGTRDFFFNYETQSVHSLVDAYLKGVEVDWEALKIQQSADAEQVKKGEKRLRQLLEQNCSKPSKKRAGELVSAETEYIKKKTKKEALKKLNAEGVDLESKEASEAISKAQTEALSEYVAEALRLSVYEPYVEHHTPAEFKPTETQLETLTAQLGFEPPLKKTTRKGVNQWLVEVTAMDVAEEHDSRTIMTPLQSRFADLLAEAAGELKARSGKEYGKFHTFCQENSKAEGKVNYTGDELNTGSPKQMQFLFYCKLGLPVRLTNWPDRGSLRDSLKVAGSPQTDSLAIKTALSEDTLEGDWRREALECVLAIKDGKTRESLYHYPYPLWRYPSDGRIHPQIKNCGTVTRRPSGTSPNILQVAKHQLDGVMRSIFIPYTKNELIVSIDFDQQELRIMASESKDKNLISCYIGDNRRDVHSMTAAGIARVDYKKYMEAYADKEHKLHDKFIKIRKVPAKRTNFLLAYMGEAPTLSRNLIIPLSEGTAMMEAAYAMYPRIQPWQDEVASFAKRNGYSITAYGNRRHARKALYSKESGVKKRMIRQLVNAEIQGCAADILKIVLTRCWETNLWRETGATLIGPVYDEITSSVTIEFIPKYINRLIAIMNITPPGHTVPMEASVSLGKNWRDLIELGVEPKEQDIQVAILEALE